MREFILLAKAAASLAKLAAAAAVKKADAPKTAPSSQKPADGPASAPTERTNELLDMVTSRDMINMGYLYLKLNENGEYTAVIASHDLPQDIAVPSVYNGLPVTEVRWGAEIRRDNKVRLFIPETVKKLDLNVLFLSGDGKRFGRWLKLIVDERSPYLTVENRCVYSKDKTVLWCAQCRTNHVTLPDTVREIAPHAFAGNMHTFGVALPHGVQVIGEGAFRYCENLRSINAENVVSIGARAFEHCVKIREFICERLHDIGDRCFYGCDQMYMAKLPVTLAEVGSEVFQAVQYLEFYDNLKAPLLSFAHLIEFVAVRSAESGDLKFKFCIDKTAPPWIIELHRYGWGEYAEFDFEKHDRIFEDYCSHNRAESPYFSITALFRLGYRYKLTEHAREYYVEWLRSYSGTKFFVGSIDTDIRDFSALYSERIKSPFSFAFKMLLADEENDRETEEQMLRMLKWFCRDGIYGADVILEFIDIFSKYGKTEYVARMLELRNEAFPYRDELELE